MYIIRLDKDNGNMYKELYDFEGFRSTFNFEEATKFRTSEEAKEMLNHLNINTKYKKAQIEKVK